MAKFIPQYLAKTAQEQARLEDKFREFANHAALISRVDYKVYVYELEEGICIQLENPRDYIRDVRIRVDSLGKDGKTAVVSTEPTVNRIPLHGAKNFVVGLEARINGTTYIVPEIDGVYC